jgi:chromosome partitioning protein
MLVMMGAEKGGVGKSTAATNLAAWLAQRGEDVVLVDIDLQGSSTNWATTRSQDPSLPKVHCITKAGNISEALRDLGQRYSHVVVDAGGKDSIELRSASLVVDKVYMPLKASQFDLWTVETMDKLVAQARVYNPGLEAMAIVCMAPTNPQVTEAQEAKEMLADFSELKLSGVVMMERKVYRDASKQGRGVMEMGENKATNEIEALAREIYGQASSKTRARRKFAQPQRGVG